MNSRYGLLSFFLLPLVLAYVFLSHPKGFCFNTGEKGHGGLADKSIELKKNYDPELKKDLNTYKQKIKDATSAEDAMISNEIIPRWMHHFYNPFTGKGLPYFENAQQRAMKMFNSALDDYCGGNKEKAWDEFGHVLHLLQDMGSPSHVHNASHVFQSIPQFSSWGFENYVSNNWPTLGSQIVPEDCEIEGGMATLIINPLTHLMWKMKLC